MNMHQMNTWILKFLLLTLLTAQFLAHHSSGRLFNPTIYGKRVSEIPIFEKNHQILLTPSKISQKKLHLSGKDI